MVRVLIEEDCGNAPRKALLRDLLASVAHGDEAFVLGWLTDDVSWQIAGGPTNVGKRAVSEAIRRTAAASPAELVIDTIITHGHMASANGTIVMEDGRRFAFCNVYRFAGAGKGSKIKAITTYVAGV